jgi:hypothetical protein
VESQQANPAVPIFVFVLRHTTAAAPDRTEDPKLRLTRERHADR